MRESRADKNRDRLGDHISVQGKMLAFHAKRDGGTLRDTACADSHLQRTVLAAA